MQAKHQTKEIVEPVNSGPGGPAIGPEPGRQMTNDIATLYQRSTCGRRAKLKGASYKKNSGDTA